MARPDVWPYFFLAHHHLIGGDFEKCRVMCDWASQKPAPDSVKSELARMVTRFPKRS